MKKPKIRFKGYQEDWEQRKLGDVFEQTANFVNPNDDDIELWSLTVEDGLTPKSERYNREFLVKKKTNFKEVRPGDIVYNPMNMTLGAVGFNGMAKSVAVSGYYTTMVANKGYDSYYINTWLKSPQAISLYKTFATGSLKEKQRVQFPTLSIIPATFPEHDEQTKIGSYFEHLDNLITLHQRKCEETKTLKKYMLQKMFPQNGHSVPEIRFSGFTEDWEQRKLNEIADKVSEKNKDNEFSEPFTNSAEQGIISQKDYFDREIVNNENLNGYYIVRNDDFIYNPRISVTAPVGPINRNRLGRNGVMSPLYTVFRTQDIDNLYLEFYFKTTKWHRFMKLNGDSGARFDRFTISSTQFMEMPIPYPTLEEQKKIGEYFDSLDNLITLHQRKYMKYADLSVFDWEQRKLGELAEIVGGGTPSTSVDSYWDGDIDWYAPAEIGEQIYLKSSQRKITEEGLNKSSAKILPVGTVLFTSRAGIGKTAILLKEGCTNQGFQSIVPNKDKLDSYFIFTRSEELKRYGETVGAGSTFVEVSGKQMVSMELMMPTTMDEQQKIGEYFSNLDHLITLHQHKCEELQNIKKFMLKNMFI